MGRHESLSIGTAAMADAISAFPAIAVRATSPPALVGKISTVAIGAAGLVASLVGEIGTVAVGDAGLIAALVGEVGAVAI